MVITICQRVIVFYFLVFSTTLLMFFRNVYNLSDMEIDVVALCLVIFAVDIVLFLLILAVEIVYRD